jgi:hypothetical protein
MLHLYSPTAIYLDIGTAVFAVLLNLYGGWFLWTHRESLKWPKKRLTIFVAALVSVAVMILGAPLHSSEFIDKLPKALWMNWLRAICFVWWMTAIASLTMLHLWVLGRARKVSAPRRRFLRAAATGVAIAPAIIAGYGASFGRNNLQIREIPIDIDGLHPDLEGFRIVQISDMHLGAFLTPNDFASVIERIEGLNADIAVATGDFITLSADPLRQCLELCSRMRTRHGVYACNGNHEIYARAQEAAQEICLQKDIRLLRQERELLQIGGAKLNLAGVDYQIKGRPYLPRAENLREAEACNILLSHNPDVFPVAARKGFDLMLSGHTHGGQIQMEIVDERLNPARFYTPYVAGLYSIGSRRAYVNAGLGTVMLPCRIGADPEVSVLTLRGRSQEGQPRRNSSSREQFPKILA